MADSSLTQVNEHYLDKVMDLSQVTEVEASEDIYAANGMKLVSKGARISSEMQERLIVHRLKKPLESSLAVNDGVDLKAILAEAQRLVDEVRPLQSLLGGVKGEMTPLKVLSKTPLNPSLVTLLSVAGHSGKSALEHAVVTSLVAASVARGLNLGEDKLQTVATAGLFHDVGKLYIHPDYLQHNRKLKPSEWRHVVSHPVIAQKLLAEVGSSSKAVGQAVLEHHERYNGYGYPQQLVGNAISIEGQLLAVAEIVASMFVRQEFTLQRAELALRLVPGEHALPIVSVLSRAAAQQETDPAQPAEALMQNRNALLKRLRILVELSADLCASPVLRSASATALLRQILMRLHLIQQALSSTGLDACADSTDALMLETAGYKDGFEIQIVILEIDWRLSELARDVTLQSEQLTTQEWEALEPLVSLLDEAGEAACGSPRS